jgi:hypothetical protein
MLSIVHQFYAMASDCTVNLCGETAEKVEPFAAAAESEVRRIEMRYSRRVCSLILENGWRIFRLEGLVELGLRNASRATGVDRVKQVRHLLLRRRTNARTGDRMNSGRRSNSSNIHCRGLVESFSTSRSHS